MSGRTGLVGRSAERERLASALEAARGGEGSIVLLSGDAGVGKSRLAADLCAEADAVVLSGAGEPTGTSPYGPLVTALRGHLRAHPEGLADCGPLTPHLALLL